MHDIKDLLVLQVFELIPLCQDTYTMCVLGCFICVPTHTHLVHTRWSRLQMKRIVPFKLVHRKIPLDLILCNLRIIYILTLALSPERPLHKSIAGVYLASVFLERKTYNNNLLVGHGVEHGRNNRFTKWLF